MPWFEYEGLTPGGTAIAGRVEAADRERAGEDLAGMQMEVREIRKADAPPKRAAPLSEDDLIFFNQQLASLAEAGIALDEGLAQLARDIESPRLRRWIVELVHDIRRGIPIDQAIAARERGLPLLYSRVIRAGIASGELPATLLNLNQHLRLAGNTRRMIWELASYPLLVAALAVTIVSGLFLMVVPRFHDIFVDFGTELPGLTVLLLAIADNYPTIMLVFALVVAGVILGWRWLRLSRTGLAIRESIIFAAPVVGKVYRASLIARFLRAVSTAVATGVPLPQAMRLGADATGSKYLIDDAEHLAGEVERGQSVFVANQSARIIPPLFGFCVQVAVGRDTLPTAIGQLARSYENRAVHAQFVLQAMLFPLLVMVLGCIVGIMIVAMFLPLVHLINCVSSG